MHIHHVTPILNVSDVVASIAWFEQLGWERGFTWNDGGSIDGAADANEHGPAGFGSVRTGHAEIFLCLRRPGRSGRGLAQLVAADAGGRGRAARDRARARHDGDLPADGRAAGACASSTCAIPRAIRSASARLCATREHRDPRRLGPRISRRCSTSSGRPRSTRSRTSFRRTSTHSRTTRSARSGAGRSPTRRWRSTSRRWTVSPPDRSRSAAGSCGRSTCVPTFQGERRRLRAPRSRARAPGRARRPHGEAMDAGGELERPPLLRAPRLGAHRGDAGRPVPAVPGRRAVREAARRRGLGLSQRGPRSKQLLRRADSERQVLEQQPLVRRVRVRAGNCEAGDDRRNALLLERGDDRQRPARADEQRPRARRALERFLAELDRPRIRARPVRDRPSSRAATSTSAPSGAASRSSRSKTGAISSTFCPGASRIETFASAKTGSTVLVRCGSPPAIPWTSTDGSPQVRR